MTPTAVHQLKLVDETLAKLSFGDWSFTCFEIDGAVFVRVWRWISGRRRPSKPFLVGERSTRYEVARLALDAVRSTLVYDAADQFLWDGRTVFGTTDGE